MFVIVSSYSLDFEGKWCSAIFLELSRDYPIWKLKIAEKAECLVKVSG